MNYRTAVVLIMGVACWFLPSIATGQIPSATERLRADYLDVGLAIQQIREGRTARSVDLLIQRHGALPPGLAEKVADSMVSVALSYRPAEPHTAFWAATAAIRALGIAAENSSTAHTETYLLPRLVRIYHGSPSRHVRASVLTAVGELSQSEMALAFLAQVASIPEDHISASAVALLGHEMGDRGIAVLRRLYFDQAVTNSAAVEVLNRIAAHRGWQRY